MATMVEQEVEEYESDPEEGKRSLAMRRRKAASDDEEGEAETPRMNRRPEIHSDESDGQGGAAEYGDDDEEEEELDEDEEEEEREKTYDEEEYEIDGEEGNEEGERDVGGGGDGVEGDKEVLAAREVEGDGRRNVEEAVERPAVEEEEEEEEKKESEPFAVPTAGAFYMHDDRFKAKGNIRHSRRGGRKLWESKDDRKWGHDKFEEMTLQERHYEEGRRASRGRYRGRGKNRGPDPGPDRGFPRENRSKAFTSNNNQNQAPKGVRGRGPRRYEPSFKNNSQAPPSQNKQSRKPLEKTSHINSGRAFTPAKNAESDSHSTAKQVFASSLSSASPPFYPSGSSNKDITLTQKRDVHGGGTSRNLRPSAMDENYSVPQANSVLRGKNIVDSIGMDKLYIDDSGTSAAGKPMTNFQMPSSGSSLGNSTQGAQSRPQGRGATIRGQMAYQPTPPHNQVNRLSPPTQLHAVQRSPVQSRVQSSVQAPTQQLGQRSGSGSQASSPPKTALSINSYEPGEVESPSETTKAKGALVGKGKGSVGRGSFIYSGTQVMAAAGNMAVSHGDQNFPAFLPVMQFGGQHPGGIGVPAVGMAFPGYVAQPQLGLGNSEMTWLPVLAGAAGALGAGALGATYCPPYIAVDGTYHARPPGQTSSMGSSSKENNTNKPNNEWKPSQRPELVSDEFGQRQNKQPRRYSEMNFGQ